MEEVVFFSIALLVGRVFFLKGAKLLRKYRLNTRLIAGMGIFSALATILYVVPLFQIKIPIFPQFLEFHFDEVPVFIASFAYGPIPSLIILFIKTLIKLPFSSTAMVGELADFLYSAAFILPASLIYRKNRTLKGVILGFVVAFFSQLAVSSVFNALFVIDFYLVLYNIPAEGLLAMVQSVNPRISDIHWSLVLWGIVPFNFVKNLLVIFITFLSYKKVHSLLQNKTH